MKKVSAIIMFTIFLVSCATEKVIPVGRINKIISPTTAIVNYPESNLQVGHPVNLVRVVWTMGKRREILIMPGLVEKIIANDYYEIKFDGTKEISETHIIRK